MSSERALKLNLRALYKLSRVDYNLKPNKGSYFQENHHGTHPEIREVPKLHSNVLS